MKNIIFTAENQTIYITYTGSNSVIRKEVYCIAVDLQAVQTICRALNYAAKNDANFYL